MGHIRRWRERLPWPVDVNDVHSSLNETRVLRVVRPKTGEDVARFVQTTADHQTKFAVCGGRHSMGGQQFLAGHTLLDMSEVRAVTRFDPHAATVTVGAGVLWPNLYAQLAAIQVNDEFRWTYRQKQTGGDRLSLGGSLSSNIHSRGLTMRPMVEDVEALYVVTPNGERLRVSRTENAHLFRFVIGGYGLFGVVTDIELRLTRRHKLRRKVELRETAGLVSAFDEKIASGYEFGDFQFTIDDQADDFLRRGVFACYEPVEDGCPIRSDQKEVPRRAWHHLVYLAHTKKTEAFRLYADFYKSTDGQIYWSDLHQMTPYLDDYHQKLDRRTRAACKGSEMITELYVPRASLEPFLDVCRTELKSRGASVIYGTIRLVESENETFLAWASQSWACVIFNLHVDHDPPGLAEAQSRFRMLIDAAQQFGGSFYLTYHRWATKEQIERSYPQMPAFLRHKREVDPQGTLCSDWHRHLQSLFLET